MSRVDWRKRLAAPVAATALAAVLLLASQDFYFFRHKRSVEIKILQLCSDETEVDVWGNLPLFFVNRLREQDQKVPPKIWLSMAVCFSSNTW